MKKGKPLPKLVRGIIALVLLLVIGTAGYMVIESWPLLDSLFMTVITLSTVGYNEPHPLTPAGRIYSIVLILGGVGTLFYILNNMVQYFLEGEFGIKLGRRRMDSKINNLNNHFVLCGYGRVGRGIALSLKQMEEAFVVIEQNNEAAVKAAGLGYLVITGDATCDTVLLSARLGKAKALILALGSDADNLYTILTAREINPALQIVTRASDDAAVNKLRLAGADRVIAPEMIGGQQMRGWRYAPGLSSSQSKFGPARIILCH